MIPFVLLAAGGRGYGQSTAGEGLSTALLSGLAVLFVLVVGGALVAVAALARRRAARRRPCPGCGLFYDPGKTPVCSGCGRELEAAPAGRERRNEPEER